MAKRPTDRANKNRRRLTKKNQLSPSAERHRRNQMLKDDFPEIVYRNESSPEYLVEEVQAIVERLKTSPEVPKDLRVDLRAIRESGYSPTSKSLNDEVTIRLGRLVYNHLMKKFRSVMQWSDDISIEPYLGDPKKLLIQCRSLEKLDSTTYFSPKKPLVTIDGREYRVVYKQHTLERIAERLVADKSNYNEWGTVFAIPYRTRYFEVVKTDTQTFVKLWNFCDPTALRGRLHHELLGLGARSGKIQNFPLTMVDGQVAYYLLGYCPLEFDETRGFAILTTMLLPGMEATPEYIRHFERKRLTSADRMEFGKRIDATALAKLIQTKDFDTIRLLHSYVPQVKVIPGPVFEYEDFPDRDTLLMQFVEGRFPDLPTASSTIRG